jgi:site-specific DNA-methyltransferase (adenine-specific)
VLQGVECDALIVDAPYSERTHKGHDEAAASAGERRELNYRPWTPADVDAFVDAWSIRARGWIVSITDHVLAPAWEAALERTGRYAFSPLAFVAPGSRVRVVGDGPAQWSCWIVVARPRSFAKWGALPGAYVLPKQQPNNHSGVVGGKPLWLMRSLVRDYSRAGDLVCDPCAGAATTLLAAVTEGRRAVGAEQDEAHFAIAQKRLARGYTPTLFAE